MTPAQCRDTYETLKTLTLTFDALGDNAKNFLIYHKMVLEIMNHCAKRRVKLYFH